MTKKQSTENRSELTTAHHDYAKGLNSYAFFKMHDMAMSQDLVQDTFTKTWAYLVRGGKIDIMKSFLYHILNGLIIDQYRKRKTVSLDLLVEKGFEPSVGGHDRIFDILDGKNAVALIKQLPERYREVIKMRYIQELTLREMSLITGQSRNAIAVQAHRGLGKLKLLYNRA